MSPIDGLEVSTIKPSVPCLETGQKFSLIYKVDYFTYRRRYIGPKIYGQININMRLFYTSSIPLLMSSFISSSTEY